MSRASTKSRLQQVKADWRASHLCLRCDHHHVCRFVAALDLNFGVAISQCNAFQPAAQEGEAAEG